MENSPEGVINTGDTDKVELSKADYDKLVDTAASRLEEITKLREKNRELVTVKPIQPDEVSKAVEAEFRKREQEDVKSNIDLATAEFLGEHPEFSKEEDPDGSKLQAFQRSLAQFSLSGIKTKEDYLRVLNNAMRLTPELEQSVSPQVSTPRVTSVMVGGKPSHKLTDVEAKLVRQNFNGDAEAYLKAKDKRPEYIEELLKFVR